MLNTIPSLLEDLGQQVRRLRINAGYSQKELAAKVNLSESTIVRLENGRSIGLDAFIKLVRGLGRLDWLQELDPIGVGLSPVEQMRMEQGMSARRQRVGAR